MNKVYIIAEAGVNHNGNLDLAIKLIENAKQAGADCVKFQTFKAESLLTKNSPKAKYQLFVTDNEETQFEMLKKLELQFSDYEILINKCKELEIDFLSTPYNNEDVDFLFALNVDRFKIASGQLTELPLLKYTARKGKPIILSTGMANMAEVCNAVEAIRQEGNNDIIVLQCTTNYPSRIEDANILAMLSIKEACKVNVGYSDHVPNNYACFAAVALGAMVIEKHFTINNELPGPDHSSSLNTEDFTNLVNGIRNIELALGNGIKRPTQSEIDNSYGMKRSLVLLEDLPKGTLLNENHIGFKRPFNGLQPNMIEHVIGKILARPMKKDQALQFDSIIW